MDFVPELDKIGSVGADKEQSTFCPVTENQACVWRGRFQYHGSRGALHTRSTKNMPFFRMCFSGDRYRKTKAIRVFISMMPMIFIFGFAKKYLLEEKLRLFYSKL